MGPSPGEIKELLEAALAREPGERSAFLNEACHGDEALRAEVESLLSGDRRAGDFVEKPASAGTEKTESVTIRVATLSLGDVLSGRFRVIRFLGRGGMGEVYEAKDLDLGERVALKTIRPEIASEPRSLARFIQEIQLARRVTHPNVCRMFDLERHRPPPEADPSAGVVTFLTMELLEGETLAVRLRRVGRITTSEALPLIQQMAEALAAAHDVGVVHRDFKPGNVMLVPSRSGDRPERAVVTDFGLARALAAADQASGESHPPSVTAGGHMIGTVAYMAPEQLQGCEATPASDIYALGLVMYEMVTGKRPFPDDALLGGAYQRITQQPVSPRVHVPDLDPLWEHAILRCLAINPAERFQSAREVLREMDREPLAPVFSTASTVGLRLAVRPQMRRRNAWLASVLGSIVALALVLVGLNVGGLRDRLRAWGHPARIKSLAVLPLENLSGQSGQDYFADGMTDELITDLAKISALRVISRTSVMQYKRAPKPVSEVARALNVDAVVEGTVLRSGDQVRITARLIDARTGGGIWGASYERDLRDVLVLQSEVATSIADEIRIHVTSQEQARLAVGRPVNTEAYEAYLKGRYEWNKPTEHDLHQARQYFEQAVEIDPNYAPAYSGLADYFWATDELPPGVKMPKAKQYALKALEIDPNLADAYTSLGVLRFYADWNWPEAEKDFRRALELDPGNAGAHRMYSVYLSAMARADEALEESHRAERLDPVSIDAQTTVGWALYYARRYDQALEQCREVVDLEPDSPGAHDCLGLSDLATRRYEKAIAESQRAVELSGNELNTAVGLARAYALEGEKAEARKILDEWRARAKQTYVAPSLLAQIYIALGEKKQGLSWLETAYADHDIYLARLKVEPAFDAVRSDPGFQDLMRRLNFPP
jgi:serine/threonine-protein kinase